MKERYLIESQGEDEQAVLKGLLLIDELCSRHNCDAYLHIPNKNSFPHIWPSKALPPSMVKDLMKGNGVTLPGSSKTLHLIPDTNLVRVGNLDVVYSLLAGKSMLKHLEDKEYYRAAVILSNYLPEISDWVSEYKPKVL